MPQRIENVLYSLINNYDDDEFLVVKKIKYNEAVVSAKGDVVAAQANYNLAFSDQNQKKTFADLLLNWAFAEDTSQVDIKVRRFSITMMKNWIIKGFELFAENYRSKEKEKYEITIDDCKMQCGENDFESSQKILEEHYEKNKWKHTFQDKFVLIYSAVCGASLLVLLITAGFFSVVALVIGILLGLAGSFLLWRRIVDMGKILLENKRQGVNVLKKAIEELKLFKKSFKEEDSKNVNLKDALERF